ncbi:DE-cadherin-like [Anopheles marshallii]|uniref:DE-cadherin-like n=1 Tax=Anopheles marshallii TaxID=1521116 RepID=UPI00237B7CF9|nr:DE-cadherin-like [Anopheles marshallii]
MQLTTFGIEDSAKQHYKMKSGQYQTKWMIVGVVTLCFLQVRTRLVEDNIVVFEKTQYKATVLEHAEVSKRVMTISAQHKLTGTCENIRYEILRDTPDSMYFGIATRNCGAMIIVAKQIDRSPDQCYKIHVRAYNEELRLQAAVAVVQLCVVDQMARKPYFRNLSTTTIEVRESCDQFQEPMIVLEANSNTPDNPHVNFGLLAGSTEQTNSKHTFRLEQINNTAVIMLSRWLDYETVSEYVLTIVATNDDGIETNLTLKVRVLDDNDETPTFEGNDTAIIPKNAAPGTFVHQVQAIDRDGTSANNVVSYRLEDDQDQFAIDSRTGIITSLKPPEHDIFLKVIAEDNSPARNGKPNRAMKMIHIMVVSDNLLDNTSPELVPTNDGVSKDIANVSSNSQKGNDVKIPEETSPSGRNVSASFWRQQNFEFLHILISVLLSYFYIAV